MLVSGMRELFGLGVQILNSFFVNGELPLTCALPSRYSLSPTSSVLQRDFEIGLEEPQVVCCVIALPRIATKGFKKIDDA